MEKSFKLEVKFYTLKDIRQFLFEHDIFLETDHANDGKVAFGVNFSSQIMILSEGKRWQDVFFKVDELNFQIFKEESEICYQDTTFSTKLVKDLSKEWIAYLVQKYPEASSLMKRIIASKMKDVHDRAEDSIKPLEKKINKIKQEEQAEMDNLRKLDVLVGEEFNSIK